MAGTNNETDLYAYYYDNYTALTFVLKPGVKYLVGKSNLSINFYTNDKLDSKNIKFTGDLSNCNGEQYYIKE